MEGFQRSLQVHRLGHLRQIRESTYKLLYTVIRTRGAPTVSIGKQKKEDKSGNIRLGQGGLVIYNLQEFRVITRRKRGVRYETGDPSPRNRTEG